MSLVDDIKAIQRAVGAEADGVFGPVTAAAVWKELHMEDTGGPPAPPLDERTQRNLASLDAKALERFTQFCLLAKATAATFGCDYALISGHRTWAEQNALYARGRSVRGHVVTHARGGYSNHNFGIAADAGVFRGARYLDADDAAMAVKVHRACAVHAKPCGLEWGGDWKTMKDFPHYEVSTGLSMAEKRALYQQHGSVL